MKLHHDAAWNIISGCHSEWETVNDDIVNCSRWGLQKEAVCKHVDSGKYYLFRYEVGATEYQDVEPFNGADTVTPNEVVLQEVIIEKWVKV